MKNNNITVQQKEFGNIHSSISYFEKFDIPKNKRILDVGCSYGSLLYNMNNAGYKKVYGIDINKKFINHGQKKYKIIAENLVHYDGRRIPFPDNSFDVIVSFDVLEHIPNLDSFLKKEIWRVLKPGGLFIFQTPNKYINIIWVYIDNKFNPFTTWWREHCSLQTYWSLKKLLKRTEFKEITIEKNNIFTNHNINKVKKRTGILGYYVLKIISHAHITIYPNLWGIAKK